MNRDAYVKANPDRAGDLEPDTMYVVIDGSSRLAAAREAGLATVKVMVSDDQGTNSEELLESALVANIHRQDLEELDEARALQRLLAIHGSQTALAKRLHRSQGWVSQRLALLNLTPELQARIGQEPIDLLRAVGNKPPEQQEAALEELKAQRARKDVEKSGRRPPRQESPASERVASPAADEGHYDVIEGETQDDRDADPAATKQADTPKKEAVPEPRTTEEISERKLYAAEARTPARLPYDDGAFVAHHLIRKMSVTEFDRMLVILNEHQKQRTDGGVSQR